MAPGTHALIGWWTANVVPLSRRDRLLIFLGGILPDLDGLGMFVSDQAYFTYHHVLCHNLAGCLVWVAVAAVAGQDRTRCVVLSILSWHLHLACDYFGSRGPMSEPPWVLPYLYPLVGHISDFTFVGPAWYWNPWQWPLNGWPNLLVTMIALAGWFYIAVRLDRTWFEFVWPAMDAELCRTLRKWTGGAMVSQWSPREGKLIRRSFVAVCVAALIACVVAAGQATGYK